MFLASKHTNIVVGLDIHMVTIPPAPAPVPMPHPFVGVILDPFDFLPILGSTVKINNVHRSNAGTMATLGTYKHIPLGAGFHPGFMSMIDHEGLQFFGSKTVKADGSYLSASPFNLMTCSCIGIPLGTPERYLPMSTTIPLPLGNPVFVGGPQVPDLLGVLMKMLMAFGLKFLLKKVGKLFKKKPKKLGCGCTK